MAAEVPEEVQLDDSFIEMVDAVEQGEFSGIAASTVAVTSSNKKKRPDLDIVSKR